MSEAEASAFIDTQKNLQVATIERDGSVHLSTLWFARVKERVVFERVVFERVVFETYTKSQKIQNLRRDPRITLLWEDGEDYAQLRGVMIKGTATLVTDPSEVQPLALAVMKRNQPDMDEEILAQAAAHMAAKRTAVVVEPHKMVSWDHRKLKSERIER